MAVSVQRYVADSKTLLGRIVPFFLRGKRVLRFLAAVSSPLDDVNNAFQTWAHDTLIDAATTSQTIVLKWSLKNKLIKYLANADDEFTFDTYDRSNYATLYESESEQLDHPEVKQIYMPENVSDTTVGDDVEKVVIRNKNEIVSESNEMLIMAPAHNSKIGDEEYLKKIKQYIELCLAYDVEYKIVISKSNK